eukprot:GFYU01002882.1.p1 GENE.GFYU01002882.1~~GFYU01002882.1.p1  ORF type:complete len:388 (+),score=115.21 GFYU01002882.1:176-1339(+)
MGRGGQRAIIDETESHTHVSSHTEVNDAKAVVSTSTSTNTIHTDNPLANCAAYSEKMTEDGLECSFASSANDPASSRLVDDAYLFVLIHYLWWGAAAGAALYAAWTQLSYGPYIVTLLIACYMPSFLNGDQLKGGRQWDAFRRHPVWHRMQRYASLTVIREEELDASKQHMFGWHPHGILILSRLVTYGGLWERLFPGMEARALGASPMFYIPGAREICLWMGAIDASKKSAQKAIADKQNIIVFPGGSKEIFKTLPNSPVTPLVLKERKGFVKLAMENGMPLVPVFVFGEKWMYNVVDIPAPIRQWFLRNLLTPLILFWGRGFTWMPLRAPLSAVFGKAMHVEKNPSPSQEEIDAVHSAYMMEVQRLFHKYKGRFGYSDEETLEFC